MWWTYVLIAFGGLVIGFIITSIVTSKRRDSYTREHEDFVKWMSDEIAKMEQKEKNKEIK